MVAGAAIAASSLLASAAPASARPSLDCGAGGRGGRGGNGGISVGGNGGIAFTVGGGFADARGGSGGSARGGSGGRGGAGVLPVCNQNTNGGVFYDDDPYWAPREVVYDDAPDVVFNGPVDEVVFVDGDY